MPKLDKKVVELLNEVLEHAKELDILENQRSLMEHGVKLDGESWLVYHLKRLKELVEK